MKIASILFVLLFATSLFLIDPQVAPEVSTTAKSDTVHAPAAGVQATPIPGPLPGCVEPPPDLRAWWTLDEAPGSTRFADRAGVLNHGHVGGATLPEFDPSGMVAGARAFDGADHFIHVDDHPELDFGTGDFSIDFWIKMPRETEPDIVPIIDKRTFGPVTGYFVHTFQGELRLQLADGGDGSGPDVCGNDPLANPCTIFTSNLQVNTGEWIFATISVDRDREDGVRFSTYVPGSEEPQRRISSSDPTLRSDSLDNDAPLLIARHADDGNDPRYFNGSLDEVEIYARAIEDDEFDSIAELPAIGKCKWPLDWTSPDPQPFGVESLTNLDAVNACGGPVAHGFQFRVYDLASPVSSTNYSFPNTFEEPCPNGSTEDCNPFSPPQVLPDYQPSQNQIVLEWIDAGQPGSYPVLSDQKRHFGYTLHQAQTGVPEHKVAVAWLTNEPGIPCSLDYGIVWDTEPIVLNIGGVGGLGSARWPESENVMQQAGSRVEIDTLQAWLSFDVDGDAEVDLRTHVSNERIELTDLISSNPIYVTSTLVAEGVPLRAGQAISATLKSSGQSWPVELTENSHALVIADVYRLTEGESRQLAFRLFHAAPIAQLRMLLPKPVFLPIGLRQHP